MGSATKVPWYVTLLGLNPYNVIWGTWPLDLRQIMFRSAGEEAEADGASHDLGDAGTHDSGQGRDESPAPTHEQKDGVHGHGRPPGHTHGTHGEDSEDSDSTASQLDSDDGHDGGHGHEEHLPFYRTPRQRHEWGVHQHALHAGWYELFLDLIYVGLAYRLGDLVKAAFYSCDDSGSDGDSGRRLGGDGGYADVPQCVGLTIGMFYSLGFFSCMFRFWSLTTWSKARVDCSSIVHRGVEVMIACLLVVAAAAVEPVHLFHESDADGANRLSHFTVPCGLVLLVWVLLSLEICLLADAQATRRNFFTTLRNCLLALLAIGAIIGLAEVLEGDAFDAAAVVCLFFVGFVVEMQLAYRIVGRKALAMLSATYEEVRHKFEERHPLRSMRPPLNIEFIAHRQSEFMMLMLGETILQLVAAEKPQGREALSKYYVTLICGFIICFNMMYSFNITEPHHAAGHVMRRNAIAAIAHMILFQFKGASVLLVGIGIKIAMYKPDADADAFFSEDQRWQLALSMFVAFGLVLVMLPLHTGFLAYYHRLELWKDRLPKQRGVVVTVQLACLGAMLAITQAEVQPWLFVALQAALSVIFCLGVRLEQEHLGHINQRKRSLLESTLNRLRAIRQSMGDSPAKATVEVGAAHDEGSGRGVGQADAQAEASSERRECGASRQSSPASRRSRSATSSTLRSGRARGDTCDLPSELGVDDEVWTSRTRPYRSATFHGRPAPRSHSPTPRLHSDRHSSGSGVVRGERSSGRSEHSSGARRRGGDGGHSEREDEGGVKGRARAATHV